MCVKSPTVDGVLDLRVGKGDRVDIVIASAANGADGQTVASRAHSTGKGDILECPLVHCLSRRLGALLTVPELTATQSSLCSTRSELVIIAATGVGGGHGLLDLHALCARKCKPS